LESVLKENGKSSPLKCLTQRLLSMLKILCQILTGGRGIYNTEFVRYEEVPPNIAEQIIEKRKAILEKEKAE